MEFADLIKTPKLDGVLLHLHGEQQGQSVEGTLCITGHHLLVSARQERVSQELWLLHQNIDVVEKKPFIAPGNVLAGGLIILKCKNLRIVSLEIRLPTEYTNVLASLEALSSLNHAELYYPFFYRPMYAILEDGYTIFRPELEFAKLLKSSGCNSTNTADTAADAASPAGETANGCEWRISNANKDFSICASYGAALIVPKGITDEQIMQSSMFRDGGRFPVLSYRHDNGATLMRSSQPMSVQGKRCRADEAILNMVLGKSKKGFIVDTWGKGKSNTETDQHYSQWKKVNRSIGNISSPSYILDSFSKLVEACNDTSCSSEKWLSRLDNCGWLNLVLNSLNAACVVAQCLDQEGAPVLVHGAKGFDSTLIVTSLVQIILNPDCRTLRGIQALIEREWIQAGHPFATRHRYGCYTPSQQRPKSAGASFVLFLDCVYQLYYQFPCSFEFSTQMLILLFEHSYFSQYGTFLCDSEKERIESKVHTRTTSLWSYLNRPDVLKNLLNPLYEPNPQVIWPSVAPISLELWNDLYLRWLFDQKYNIQAQIRIQELITEEKELRTKAIKLRKQALELSQEVQQLAASAEED